MLLEVVVFLCCLGAFTSYLKTFNVLSIKGLAMTLLMVFGLITAPEVVLGLALIIMATKAKVKYAKAKVSEGGSIKATVQSVIPPRTNAIFDRMIKIAASSTKPVADVIYRNQPK